MARFEMDLGAGGAARLGLIVLSTDETLEYEARQLLSGREAALLHTRIRAEAEVTPEALGLMEGRITETAGLLPEGLGVIGYACTSAATVIGPARVAALVRAAHPEAEVTNPISAVIAALDALGARKIAFVSPYVPSVTAPMRALLAEQGIETLGEASFGESDDATVAKIAPAAVMELANAAVVKGCEAVFISCTNLRSLQIVEEAEARLGLPVVSSNLALVWDMARRVGLRLEHPARLFQL